LANQIDPTAQREFAVEVVERLRAAGHVAYWAGGCVRDALLGRPPKDFDVATGARPDQIRDLFGHNRTLPIGAAFGVITVLGKKSAGPIEVATFRQDAAYSDGRHPDAVVFSTPEQDALRRDFTINGLFYDPMAQQVLDFVGGQTDLKAGVIRAIGQPRERFSEDKLRLLRAVRFAVRFGFAIESATRQAIEEMADQIKVVSIERIAAELRLILLNANRRQGVEMLDDVGLLAVTMPDVFAARHIARQAGHDEWPFTLDVLAQLDDPSFPLALATFVHRWLPAEEVAKLGQGLKLSTAETQRAVWLVTNYENLVVAHTLTWPKLQRLLVAEGAGELLAMAEAIVRASDGDRSGVEHCRRQLSLPADELNPPRLITGDDLKAHGISPGPRYQNLLEAVRDAQLQKTITTKAEALALVDKLRKDSDR
jgi:poly(A) polymerase